MKKKPQKVQPSVEERAASLKRTLTFLILILMIMSLTVCQYPSEEEIRNQMETPQETSGTEGN